MVFRFSTFQTVVAYIAAVTMDNSQPIIMEDSQQWIHDSQRGDDSPFHHSQETLSLPGNGDLDADTGNEEKKSVNQLRLKIKCRWTLLLPMGSLRTLPKRSR